LGVVGVIISVGGGNIVRSGDDDREGEFAGDEGEEGGEALGGGAVEGGGVGIVVVNIGVAVVVVFVDVEGRIDGVV